MKTKYGKTFWLKSHIHPTKQSGEPATTWTAALDACEIVKRDLERGGCGDWGFEVKELRSESGTKYAVIITDEEGFIVGSAHGSWEPYGES